VKIPIPIENHFMPEARRTVPTHQCGFFALIQEDHAGKLAFL
jgi:hypothetical protein